MSDQEALRRKNGIPKSVNRLEIALAVVLLALGFVHPSIRAQEAERDPYARFDGKMVSRVGIVGSSLNPDSFRPLIKQRSGEPFSSAAIQESIRALQNTGEFSKVRVEIDQDQTGLDVSFVLDPSSFVGMIFFPGAVGKFSYTRLLQAANIPEQSPYEDDLLQQGQNELLQFFQTQGYFAATVEPEMKRDGPHSIVNLVFHTDLKSRARVGSIDIKGVSPQEAADIRKGLGSIWKRLKRESLRSGQGYSAQRIQKASDYIRSRLRSENRLAPTVRFASSKYDPDSNRADLTFEVAPGPLVSVRIEGARISARTRRREIPVYEEGSADRELADEGQRNLVSYLQSKGYFDAQVGVQFEQQPDRVTIVYNVKQGVRHRVEGVYFQGNRYFSDSRLRSAVFVKKGRSILGRTIKRGKFSDDYLQKSVNALLALYKNAGFANVSVTPKVEDHEPQVDVTFQISEQERQTVGTLRIEGNLTQSVRAISGNHPLNLEPEKPYSPRLLDLDRNQIVASYFDLGYLNARFESTVTPSPANPNLMDVVYKITEGPRGHIGNVVLLGEEATRPGFIRSVTPNVREGKPMSQGNFFTAESDLYNLNIFDWASVRPLRPVSDQNQSSGEEIPDRNQDEVLVRVHEAKRYTMDIGGGVEVVPRSGNIPAGTVALPGIPPVNVGSEFTVSQESFFGPRFSFSIARNNMLGRAQTAAFSVLYSPLDQSGTLTYSAANLHGPTWNLLVSFSAERTTENAVYTAVLGTASIQAKKALDEQRTKNLIFRYSYQRTDLSDIVIPDLVLPQDQHVRLSTFSAEYVRDTRDHPLDARKGVFQSVSIGITPKVLGSSADFFRFLGQSAFYVPARPWLIWANRIRLGLELPFAGSDVPTSERSYSGGPDSLRGFPVNGAGPQRPVQACSNPNDPSTCTLISVPVGGKMLFIFNSEARFSLGLLRNLGAVIFYDGGNVYSNINFRQLADSYTNTLGVGLRYRTPVGPIRFDVGYRLTSVPGVRATQYFVTIGESF